MEQLIITREDKGLFEALISIQVLHKDDFHMMCSVSATRKQNMVKNQWRKYASSLECWSASVR